MCAWLSVCVFVPAVNTFDVHIVYGGLSAAGLVLPMSVIPSVFVSITFSCLHSTILVRLKPYATTFTRAKDSKRRKTIYEPIIEKSSLFLKYNLLEWISMLVLMYNSLSCDTYSLRGRGTIQSSILSTC